MLVDAYCSKNSCWAEATVVSATDGAITVVYSKWADVEEVIVQSDFVNRLAPHRTIAASK